MGRALAQQLSAAGSPVAVMDYDADGLEHTVASLSGPYLSDRFDVRDRQSQLQFAAKVADWAPEPIGAVFNNAGVLLTAAFTDEAIEDDDWLMRINLEGVINGARAFLPLLLRQGSGVIVNTSSIAGLAGMPYTSAYCTSKFAVRGFTESLRHELAGTGVRAVTVHPGYVKTDIAVHGRMHSYPGASEQGNEQLLKEFTAMCSTTSERAAAIIIGGVDGGKARVLVGPDAYVFDAVTRLAPTHYWALLGRFEQLLVRIGGLTVAR